MASVVASPYSPEAMTSPSPAPYVNSPPVLNAFYLYDISSSVFTNSILLIPLLITDLAKKVRSGEERSDELRKRAYGISLLNFDTSIRIVTVANFSVVSNFTNTSSFTTRFARYSRRAAQSGETSTNARPRLTA